MLGLKLKHASKGAPLHAFSKHRNDKIADLKENELDVFCRVLHICIVDIFNDFTIMDIAAITP